MMMVAVMVVVNGDGMAVMMVVVNGGGDRY